MMNFAVVTLFPEMFEALKFGVVGNSIQKGLLSLSYWNPRDFSADKNRKVDNKPYGGGPGMVMMAQPLHDAVQAAKQATDNPVTIVYLSPQGKPFTQATARSAAALQGSIILVAGRYEGVDERFIQLTVDVEWSIGDYVISGGEFAAMVVIDAIARCIPTVIQQQSSVMQDSFGEEWDSMLKYPQYTKPRDFLGVSIPTVLHSGDHLAIKQWRLKQALGNTWQKRPDLIAKKNLTQQEKMLLNEFQNEH